MNTILHYLSIRDLVWKAGRIDNLIFSFYFREEHSIHNINISKGEAGVYVVGR